MYVTSSMTAIEATALVNKVLDNYLDALHREKVLTDEQRRALEGYRVVMVERGFFGELWSRIWKHAKPNWRITVVRILEAERHPMEGE